MVMCINLVLGGGQVLVLVPVLVRDSMHEELMSLLPPASVYKRPQTAAAPTLSSPCLMHRSENTEREREKKHYSECLLCICCITGKLLCGTVVHFLLYRYGADTDEQNTTQTFMLVSLLACVLVLLAVN